MNIQYKSIKDFEEEQLRDLFLSIEWDSGNYPDKLKIAMKNSSSVYSAWDGDKLVGLVNCLSDGIMTAYIHFMLVRPDYQCKGIGKKLMSLMLDEYKDYLRKVLIAYPKALEFYKRCGFCSADESIPMFITTLKT
ncbi:MAG TPA: GNAT family N-acetyltransferase [Acetivibrio sp.]|uniref:GNAT family N-acetyltransferase n=1 Tax=Acetivibrio sp. TaxID=1872092 RepID=UPI002B5229B7|nr:GNAT family N-acetyltransferase [Acetivibrio sp.]HOM02971.1 GNAT family N-acetyltransferase [Acetivibrio sp.]